MAKISEAAARLAARHLDRRALDALVSVAVRRALVAISVAFKAQRPGDDITIYRYAIMSLVARNGGIPQMTLARVTGVAPPRTSAVVSDLVAHGWVEKQPIEGDQRLDGLHLTEEGRAEFEVLQGWMGELDARVTARLSAAERATLLELLAKVGGQVGEAPA